MIYSFFSLVLINLILSVSVLGYGKLLLKCIYFKKINGLNYYSIIFILGLVITSLIANISSFFIPITDTITFIYILIGTVIFFYIFKGNYLIKEITTIIFIVLFASLFSFYSKDSDDFSYHLFSILYYKENVLERGLINNTNELRIAFNSIWFSLNSLIALKSFKVSFFFISSFLYASVIYDLGIKTIQNYKDKLNSVSSLYCIFSLIYLLGVVGKYQNMGSDLPGQIIIVIIIFVFFENFEKSRKFNERVFIVLLILSLFAFQIKITNILILPLILFLYLFLDNKFKIFLISLILMLPIFIWLYQNYYISGCYIFPIPLLCLENIDQAIFYNFVIGAFSKSIFKEGIPYETSEYLFDNFRWIKFWLNSHFSKILEKTLLYFIILILPISFLIINFVKNPVTFKNILKQNDFFSFKIFSIISLINILIWFLYFPTFRFGSVYILNFMLIFIIPTWLVFLRYNKKYFKFKLYILIFIICIFTFNSINKFFEYQDRWGKLWPSFKNCENFNHLECSDIY